MSQVKRSGLLSTGTSRKRRRIEDTNARPKKRASSTAVPLSVNQLAWKEVALPDRFEDAEGFLGLEEIDNVEVVRDHCSREVQYRVGKSTTESINCL